MTMQVNKSPRPRVDAGQLWAGGLATAVVAGLAALVGVLASRWLFSVPILAPQHAGAYGDAHTTGVVLAAAGVAVIATALVHLLLVTTPRPLGFFGWIIALATAVAVIFPFSTTAPLSQKIATGAVALVIGIAIGTLLASVAVRSTRPAAGPGDDQAGRPRHPAEPRWDEPRWDTPAHPHRPADRAQDW